MGQRGSGVVVRLGGRDDVKEGGVGRRRRGTSEIPGVDRALPVRNEGRLSFKKKCKPLRCAASLISDKHKTGTYFVAVRVSSGTIHGEREREHTFVAVRVSWGNEGSGSGIYR